MFGFLTRKRANRGVIEGIYAALVARARDPLLFTDLKIADEFESRFEALTFFCVLATRRLKAMPAPAPDLAQDVIDHVFAQFDRALREAGIGDLTVPKRMKTMASAFLGRASAYDQALQSGDQTAFSNAILRNIYVADGAKTKEAQALAALGFAFDAALQNSDIAKFAETIKSAAPASLFTQVSSS